MRFKNLTVRTIPIFGRVLPGTQGAWGVPVDNFLSFLLYIFFLSIKRKRDVPIAPLGEAEGNFRFGK
jgi:hypothetical protein